MSHKKNRLEKEKDLRCRFFKFCRGYKVSTRGRYCKRCMRIVQIIMDKAYRKYKRGNKIKPDREKMYYGDNYE